MLEATIYALLTGDETLSSVCTISPTQPAENSPVPYLTYTVASAEPALTLDGPSNLTRYTVQVDVWAVTLREVLLALGIVKNVLHGYRGGEVQLCTYSSYFTDQQDAAHHGQYLFDVWADDDGDSD